jgi:hypothetical protein
VTADEGKLREHQLAEVRRHIREWREDAAECQRRADACQRTVAEHLAEAARSTELARRWEAIHDAIRLGLTPLLDVSPFNAPETEEVPF